MKSSYEDLFYKPHHESENHPKLSMEQRAAQFMPFAALTGFSESIEMTADKTVQAVLEKETASGKEKFPESDYFRNAVVNQGT